MTKDRVRQLAETAANYYFGRDTALTLPDIFERAILSALDEALGEPSEEMVDAGYTSGHDCSGCTSTILTCSEVWRSMSAVRRAELRPSKPER